MPHLAKFTLALSIALLPFAALSVMGPLFFGLQLPGNVTHRILMGTGVGLACVPLFASRGYPPPNRIRRVTLAALVAYSVVALIPLVADLPPIFRASALALLALGTWLPVHGGAVGAAIVAGISRAAWPVGAVAGALLLGALFAFLFHRAAKLVVD